jgi:hypothetical protein
MKAVTSLNACISATVSLLVQVGLVVDAIYTFCQLGFIDSLTAGSTLVVASSKLRLPFRYHGTRTSKEYEQSGAPFSPHSTLLVGIYTLVLLTLSSTRTSSQLSQTNICAIFLSR